MKETFEGVLRSCWQILAISWARIFLHEMFFGTPSFAHFCVSWSREMFGLVFRDSKFFLLFWKLIFEDYCLDCGNPVLILNPVIGEVNGGAGKSFFIQMYFFNGIILLFLKLPTINNSTIFAEWQLVDALAHFRRMSMRSSASPLCLIMRRCDKYLSQFAFWNKRMTDSWCSFSESVNHISEQGFFSNVFRDLWSQLTRPWLLYQIL